MNVFETRNQLIHDYQSYISSFIRIRDERIDTYVKENLDAGALWPDPLIQLNPSFEPDDDIDSMVRNGVLHWEAARVFRRKRDRHDTGTPLRLHRHQAEAIRTAGSGESYVLTTGTGSGKSLSYIVPIVDHILRRGPGKGIQAIVVYPMNALANSQAGELEKFLKFGYPDGRGPVTYATYTGQERDEDRRTIMANPPDIILTNYVMLELILTRPHEQPLVEAAKRLKFLVLDELHTYRGRQGADVALLVRRVRDRLERDQSLQVVGTSATMAGGSTYDEQRKQVAVVASRLFGATVRPDNVIGETIRRTTPELDLAVSENIAALRERVELATPPAAYGTFVTDPLASWIESSFGVTREPGTGRLIRTTPRSITGEHGATRELSGLTGIDEARCELVLQAYLMAGFRHRNPETGFPAFAFRLHQFIGKGDTVYTSLEAEVDRHITMYGQKYKPGSRDHVLLPMVFCRECGEGYFAVRRTVDPGSAQWRYVPRELGDRFRQDGDEAGYLHFSTTDPWPSSDDEILDRLPEDWLDESGAKRRVLRTLRAALPQPVRVAPDGTEAETGLPCHYIKAPFRFCVQCGVSYDARQGNDFAKLAPLSSEGRSTATTILSMSTIQALKQSDLDGEARKLLSFTDNRQDASLQAGHFNDFVEIGLLRSAIYRAVCDAGPDGIDHSLLTQKVFDALKLPIEHYAIDATVKFQARKETDRALREVLGYRIYRDLKRGWRITSPNLEQCGLLKIQYLSLDEVCDDEETWEQRHAALATATPETRMRVAKVLLDFMRRELAVKVDYLDSRYMERVQQLSSQRLIEPWGLDEDEQLEFASILFPRSRQAGDYRGHTYLSARGGFGRYLRRRTTFPDLDGRLTLDDTQKIIVDLLQSLQVAGLVEQVEAPKGKDDLGGFQVPASAMAWLAGHGTEAFHDPIRVLTVPDTGRHTNNFFVQFYKQTASELLGLRAHEHTAQVPYDKRKEREDDFRKAVLPVLYCSPTMELGVDISELNVVNMRNVPPTPANYAQRSGRAGRSGQPALVFTYCTTGSPHDQYFFKRPENMVAGSVTPPRLDLANEDLVRSHIHAIWLAETGQSLGHSLKDLLDMSGDPPSLDLLPEVRDTITAERYRQRAKQRALNVLASLEDELKDAAWFREGWLDTMLEQIVGRFSETCDRWRTLYRAAMKQREVQNRIIGDASRSAEDKNQAKRLRSEAEAQLELLAEVENVTQSDFYSYRYFASEGFLPGYSFPRLPISAFIPARRARQQDEFLSRPRFLAISEFGPRSILYHEGSRYLINKVIMPIGEEEQGAEGARVPLRQAKLCQACGYLHPITDGVGQDLCERCGARLERQIRQLFRMQNVSTKRREKINSDEEERMRLGYEVLTTVRFAQQNGQTDLRMAAVTAGDGTVATLSYGHTATLWRINLGWARRKNKEQYGFVLDAERGFWARNEEIEDVDQSDPMSQSQIRVVPFVEDRRNCLVFQPNEALDEAVMASLQAALKNAIQVAYQLEDNELAAEPLPDADNRRVILFYEASEGGAGVLRRLVDDPRAMQRVARKALEICHFDPETGEDLGKAPRAREKCEAACYDCLMSYSNQRDHQRLDRMVIRDILLDIAGANVASAPAPKSRADHLAELNRLAGSELERAWLRFLDERNLRLPSRAQVRFDGPGTRPDFVYDDERVAVYVDGPIHEYANRHERDQTLTRRLRAQGYTVIRFAHNDDWARTIAAYPDIFGEGSL
ncbi:MAG: DEAD/DEAH box helicase [Chloroflexota bacterium]|nr:DEAD/DEAH box helicase [Chloroflexota bacterium]